jgi:hypothetical protein
VQEWTPLALVLLILLLRSKLQMPLLRLLLLLVTAVLRLTALQLLVLQQRLVLRVVLLLVQPSPARVRKRLF